MNKFPKWLLVFNSVSSTNLRMYLTCLLAMGTGIHYWATNIVPADSWLFFMGSLSGIDVAQFTAKRITHREGASDPSTKSTISKDASTNVEDEDSTASTDISELSKNNAKG